MSNNTLTICKADVIDALFNIKKEINRLSIEIEERGVSPQDILELADLVWKELTDYD